MKLSIKNYLKHAELSPDERREVLEDLFIFGKANVRPYLIRMGVLMVLSTIIATAGLISDSAAVVIGAMLVAPMMGPVMAAAGAVVMGWSKRFYGAGAVDGRRGRPAVRNQHTAISGYPLHARAGSGQDPANVL